MMPEAAAEFHRLLNLIDQGVLPKTATPRFFYFGHDIVYTYGERLEDEAYKCVTCSAEWLGQGEHTCEKPDVHQTNVRRDARWRCRSCKAEWDGEDGMKCPTCGTCAHVGGGLVTCSFCGATLNGGALPGP